MENPQITKRMYELNDLPPLAQAIPLGLQHILAMFAGNITVPLIIAGALGIATGEIAFLLQCAMFASGITTIIQALGLGPIGARLPIVMGVSFTFVPAGITIAQQYGFSALFGAILVCGILEAVFGYYLIKHFRKFFPPVVTGSVVLVIGLALLGTGITYAAGGFGAADFGSLRNFGLALFTLVVIVLFQQFGKGFFSAASVLIGIVVGYVAAVFLGMVDFSQLSLSGWISLPQPLKYGITFQPVAIGIMLILYIASMLEFIGDTTGVAINATDREPTKQELMGGILCDGLGSSFSGLFNSMPNVSYSQNVGLVGLTGVASRYVVGIGGIILALLAFIPKIGTLIALMPNAVLGGASIAMFGMIASSGIKVISMQALTQRNLLIIALALGIGMGLAATPGALQNYPFYISAVITGVPGAALIALILNAILPKNAADEKVVEEGNNTP